MSAQRLASRSSTFLSALLRLVVVLHPKQHVAALYTERHSFGIGFDLTPAYGTVAVSFPNGSNVPLARIEGDESWRSLMCNSMNFSPPLYIADCRRYDDTNSTAQSIIADMLRSLRAAGERSLDRRIEAAAATMSAAHDTQLGEWLIKSAFAAADIEYLPIVGIPGINADVLRRENSMLAGHDLGLCHPYTSSERCYRDDDGRPTLPLETYYLVGYYENEVEVTTTADTLSAYAVYQYPFVNFNLGAEMRYKNPDEIYYWEEVRDFLSLPLIQFWWRKPGIVILYGDRSDDRRFREMVMQVLTTFLTEEEMPRWINDGQNATFVGAMGAAEFAKRKPFLDQLSKGHVDANGLVQQKSDL